MALTPKQLAKLGQSSAPNPSLATSVDGLTVGDRGYIHSTLESVINVAIGGSQKMGGSDGLLDKLDARMVKFSAAVQTEVRALFAAMMSKISSTDEDEEVKIDEKQFKEMQEDGINNVFSGGLTKKITSQFKEKVGSFLKGKFLKSIFNSKIVKGTMDKISQTGTFIKNSIGNFVTKILPNITKYITASVEFMKRSMKFMTNLGNVIGKIGKAIGTIMWRLGVMFVMSAVRFAIFMAGLAWAVATIIGSFIVSFVSFMVPIIGTLATIALGVLFIAGIVFLILFGFYLFYNFIKTWIDKGFGEAIKELFSSGAVAKAFEQTLTLLESTLGLKPGTLYNVFSYLYNLDFLKIMKDWVTTAGISLLKDIGLEVAIILSKLPDMVIDGLGKLWNIIKGPLATFFEPVISGMKFVWSLLKDGWKWLESLPYVGFIFKWLKDTFVKGWIEVSGWIKALYENSIGAVVSGVENVTQAVFGEAAIIYPSDIEANLHIANVVRTAMTKMMKKKGYGQDAIQKLWRTDWQNSPQRMIELSQLKTAIQSTNEIVAFSRGGIALSPIMGIVAESGNAEAVIPLNAQGAKFLAETLAQTGFAGLPMSSASADVIKSIMESVVAEESASNGNKEITAKLDSIMKQQVTSTNRGGMTVVSQDQTANFLDMVAKGMLE